MRLELAINDKVLATTDVEVPETLPDVVRAGLMVDTSPLTDDE